MPDLAAMSNAQAADWIIAEAPISTAGFGRAFVAKLGEVRAADIAAAEARVAAAARAAIDDRLSELQAAAKLDTYSECVDLVDDAVLLGEDPKAAIVRERDRPPRGGPRVPPAG